MRILQGLRTIHKDANLYSVNFCKTVENVVVQGCFTPGVRPFVENNKGLP